MTGGQSDARADDPRAREALKAVAGHLFTAGDLDLARVVSRRYQAATPWISARGNRAAGQAAAMHLVASLQPVAGHLMLPPLLWRSLLAEMANCAWGVGFIVDRTLHRSLSLVMGREDLLAVLLIWSDQVVPSTTGISYDASTGRFTVASTGFIATSYARAVVHLAVRAARDAAVSPEHLAKEVLAVVQGSDAPGAIGSIVESVMRKAAETFVQRLSAGDLIASKIVRSALSPIAARGVVREFGQAAREYYEGYGKTLPAGPPRPPEGDAPRGTRSGGRGAGARIAAGWSSSNNVGSGRRVTT